MEMAKRITAVYADHPQAKAAMVTGSVAIEQSDFRSDIDMFVYYDELPAEEELSASRLRLTDQEPIWRMGHRDEGGFAEAIRLNGVECQIGHQTLFSLKASIASVREELEIDTPEQKALSGILDCTPLYGEAVVLELKALVADYPDALSRAMIERHLNFFQLWNYSEAMESRDAWFWQQRIVLEAAENLFTFSLASSSSTSRPSN